MIDGSDGVCIDGRCAPSCAPEAPFTSIESVVELDAVDAMDLEATLSDDQLTVYFTSDRAGAGDLDLWMASRASVDQPFGTPTPVAELNTAARESYPSLTADGLELYAQTTAGRCDMGLRGDPGDCERLRTDERSWNEPRWWSP